ncbi:hypothetical protein EDB85DRAFT_1532081 [Lactarius pseudohatsudake]|nr:hypothetical protein EDB85DRAFT_1532081 [Lactarius pseudohatsudake]
MQLYIFALGDERGSLRGMGSAIDLLPFYSNGESIAHACFVHGRDEILLVDSGAQARIFSLTMLQPKPATLQLPQVPRAIYSSPDGSCALVVQTKDWRLHRDGVPLDDIRRPQMGFLSHFLIFLSTLALRFSHR